MTPSAEQRRHEVEALHRRYAAGPTPELETELLRQHWPIAAEIASRFADRGETSDDLRQVARFALLRALRRYDPARGVRFSSYAVPTVVGELKRHLRDKAWLVRPPRRVQEGYLAVHAAREEAEAALRRSPTVGDIARFAAMGEGETRESLAAGNSRRRVGMSGHCAQDDDPAIMAALARDDPGFAAAEDAMFARQLIALLPEAERHVVVLSIFAGLTQVEIAARLGTSQSSVSRLRRHALARLRAWCDDGRSAA
ncbi:MAG TPA: sigma-70 family RNA polymerase sigma factor [Acidimicrobiales bacterium]|nr:sigma-70 family RNA polymerase sigma factor [Acidimicrobiales bacterium]